MVNEHDEVEHIEFGQGKVIGIVSQVAVVFFHELQECRNVFVNQLSKVSKLNRRCTW